MSPLKEIAMLELLWEDIAQDDLISIVVYIAADNPAAAVILKEEIEQRVAELRRHPRLYKLGRVEGTREMVVRQNYIVVYKEDDQTVTVLRVLHAARSWS